MTVSILRRLLLVLAGCTLTIGCGSVAAPSLPAGGHRLGQGLTSNNASCPCFKVLHVFGATGDGQYPQSPLVYYNGFFYGTTRNGGANGMGTVYTIAPSGSESVLYSFAGSPDASNPEGKLTLSGGLFYGASYSGGTNSTGSVFTVTPAGSESVLYSFGNGATDGTETLAGVVALNGNFYGTTIYTGGTTLSNGTVYMMSPSGAGSQIYSFSGTPDGSQPFDNLIAIKSKLYGTTSSGGTYGDGTIFSITPKGVEHVLYSFGAQAHDGANPGSSLLNVNGTLYGTTESGGANSQGTVFSITPSGTYTLLYSFQNGSDGSGPTGLTIMNGTLYGVTIGGGTYGAGTIFSYTLTGTETVLHSFDGQDGYSPERAMTPRNGTLYGVTSGAHSFVGTAFKITP